MVSRRRLGRVYDYTSTMGSLGTTQAESTSLRRTVGCLSTRHDVPTINLDDSEPHKTVCRCRLTMGTSGGKKTKKEVRRQGPGLVPVGRPINVQTPNKEVVDGNPRPTTLPSDDLSVGTSGTFIRLLSETTRLRGVVPPLRRDIRDQTRTC